MTQRGRGGGGGDMSSPSVTNPGSAPGQGKTGIVQKLVTGEDRVVRGAQVKVITKGKATQISRPVQHLYPLEIKCKTDFGPSVKVNQ